MNAPRQRLGAGGPFTARLHRAERRRQILHHAKQLFVTLGYQHTTTEKIARAAGVTEPVLYRHFVSKKVLFLEVLGEIRAAALERWQGTRDAHPTMRLRALIEAHFGDGRDLALDWRLMHRTLIEAEDPDIAAALRGYYLDAENALAEVIIDGQAAGLVRPDVDPRLAAWRVLRNALGFTLTEPLAIPLYQEAEHRRRAIDDMMASFATVAP